MASLNRVLLIGNLTRGHAVKALVAEQIHRSRENTRPRFLAALIAAILLASHLPQIPLRETTGSHFLHDRQPPARLA